MKFFFLLLILLILLALLWLGWRARAVSTAEGVNEAYTPTHVGAH